jgi:hypothetical protein
MPTMDNLGSLYKKRIGSRNMTHLLKTTDCDVRSGETKSPWLPVTSSSTSATGTATPVALPAAIGLSQSAPKTMDYFIF